MEPIKYIGAALVAAAALGFVACNNDSVNAPDFSGSNSSAVEQRNQQTSSSSFAKREPGSSGDVALSSDEKIVTQSSSSVAISSSGKIETCKHVTDIVCEPCPPGEKCSCHPCDSNKEFKSYDCSSGVELHCENGEWLTPKQFCPNGRWTTSCNGLMLHNPVCCTEKETCVEVSGKVCAPCMEGYKCPCNPCDSTKDKSAIDCSTGKPLVCKDGEWSFLIEQKSSSSVTAKSSSSIAALSSSAMAACKHISDYDGMTAQGNCVNQNGTSAVDCVTGGNYQCKNNNWTKVSCLNIKPDECKPGMGGCGYRLCEPNGIKEIADCENSVTYVCNGESWVVKKTEENQRCARGELEYCNACFEEGKFEGHYQCVKGKWQKMGVGDEICEHITDLECKIGEGKCGACETPKKGEKYEVNDCTTGERFVCQNGFWAALVVDCNALIPECGYSEYDLCMKHNLTEYCNGKWLDEPCDTDSSRDLVVYENGKKLTNRGGNYICVNGKWIERFRYYECGEKEDCVPESVRCQASPAIGTACNNEGVPAEFDGCTLICSGGAYLYAPPPTW